MAKPSRTMNLKPLTPVRKLFLKLDLLKPSNALGKRRRDQRDHCSNAENENPLLERKTTTTVSRAPPACVALQNEDLAEDVVVITTLNSIPFCCHEDLLTMSREQLVSVARTLNAKLPSALKIDTSHYCPDSFIRNSIELIVGLRIEVPPAPKAVRLHSDSELHKMNMNRSPPTSPLALRTRSYDFYAALGSPRLAKLDEEDEDSMVVDRPPKRRRVSPDTIAQKPSAIGIITTPLRSRHMIRAQSCQGALEPPTRKKVLRSYDPNFPAEVTRKSKALFDSTFYPRNRKIKNTGSVKARVPEPGMSGNANGSFLSVTGQAREASTSTSTIGPDETDRFLPDSTPLRQSSGYLGLKKRRRTDDDEMMALDIDGMSMVAVE